MKTYMGKPVIVSPSLLGRLACWLAGGHDFWFEHRRNADDSVTHSAKCRRCGMFIRERQEPFRL